MKPEGTYQPEEENTTGILAILIDILQSVLVGGCIKYIYKFEQIEQILLRYT